MLSNARQDHRQLLRFTVPGLPETALAVALFEVLAVDELPALMPVPFMPAFVLGLGQWSSRVITAIDIADLLRYAAGDQVELPERDFNRFVVAQAILDERREVIAWPVLPGADVCTVPPQAERVDTPSFLSSELIYATVTLDGRPLVLLDLERLGTYEGQLASLRQTIAPNDMSL